MSKATQMQLELVAALGGFDGRDITKEQASTIIDEAKAQGVEPDWKLKDKAQLKILQIMKRRAVAALKKEQDPEERKELEAEIENWEEEIKDWKQDLKDEKEDARDRINMFHEEITDCLGYERLTKKPTKAEIKAIVEGMDEARPNWECENNADDYLIGNLYNNFEHLRTKAPRPKAKQASPPAQPRAQVRPPVQPKAQSRPKHLPRTPKKKRSEANKILLTVLFTCLGFFILFLVASSVSSMNSESERDKERQERVKKRAEIEERKRARMSE